MTDAALRRWQRSILGISWKDEEVGARTGQQSIENSLNERRLVRWLCCYDLLTPVTTSPKYTENYNAKRIKYFTIRTKYKQ